MNYQPQQLRVIGQDDSLRPYRRLSRRVGGESPWQSDGIVREMASCGTCETIEEIRNERGPRRWRSNACFRQENEHDDVPGEAP